MGIYFKKTTYRRAYKVVDIVVYDNGTYYYKNQLSENTIKRLLLNLSEEETRNFNQLITKLNREANI